MSDTAGSSAPGAGPARRPPGDRGLRVLTALLPAATFLVGLLIGFGIWGWSGSVEDPDAAVPPGAAEATDAPPGDDGAGRADRTVTTTVPEECLAAVDGVDRSLGLAEDAAAAVADLDVARLRRLVDELRSSTTQTRALGEECRAEAEVTIGTTGAAPPS